jgi:predicted transposase/invertase (TIGR01784 family)
LPKLKSAMQKPVSEMTPAEMWGIFFGHANEPKHGKLLREIIMAKEEIGMANELLTGISQEEKERAHYRSRKMYRMDEEHNKAVAHREGFQKGLEEGMEKGLEKGLEKGMEKGLEKGMEKKSTEVAKNLLKMNLSIDMTAEATGLSRAQIERLRDAGPEARGG